MTEIAIRVENLGKRYPAVSPRARRIGRAQQRHATLRDALVGALPRTLALPAKASVARILRIGGGMESMARRELARAGLLR